MDELQQAGFLIGAELTDREPRSVMQAQFALQILHKIQVINQTEFTIGIQDVNDLDHIPQDRESMHSGGNQQFGQIMYHPTQTVYVVL